MSAIHRISFSLHPLSVGQLQLRNGGEARLERGERRVDARDFADCFLECVLLTLALSLELRERGVGALYFTDRCRQRSRYAPGQKVLKAFLRTV